MSFLVGRVGFFKSKDFLFHCERAADAGRTSRDFRRSWAGTCFQRQIDWNGSSKSIIGMNHLRKKWCLVLLRKSNLFSARNSLNDDGRMYVSYLGS